MLPDHLPVLEHPLIRLRPFRADDADLVAAVADDPLIPLVTSVPVSGSRAEALAFIERQHERLASGVGYSFAIADVRTDEAVGQVGVWLRNYDQGRVSIGYWVGGRFRRKGFAAAALRRVTEWALSLDGVERLELYVEPWNEGSWRAAERAGYQREGLMRAWQRVGPELRDMYMYSLLGASDRGGQGFPMDHTADRLAIHEVISQHGHLFDEGEFGRLGEIFTSDVRYDVEDMGGGVLEGISAIVEAARALGDRNPLAHHVTNTVVETLEGDVASARSKGLGVMAGGAIGSVTYEDVLVRTSVGWRISRRTVRLRRRPLTA